jgi:hypothetical protein
MNLVNQWLDEVIADLKTNYIQMGLKASGKWGEELDPKVEQTQTGIKAKVLGLDYTEWIANGRQPNKDQSKARGFAAWASKPNGAIYNWCKAKGVDTVAAFPIALKIAKKGWQVPNTYNKGGLVTDVINETKIKSLTDRFMIYYLENARSEVIKQWQLPA